MPSPTSIREKLKDLLAENSLSRADMKEILEGRRRILARCFDKITLSTLGKMEYLDTGYGRCSEIGKDNPIFISDTKDGRLSLETQGIFAGGTYARRVLYSPQQKTESQSSADGVYNTFGLSRSGEWLFIKVEFALARRYSHASLHEKAVTVLVLTECGLWPILDAGISPISVCRFFSNTVKDWVRTRERLYRDVLTISEHLHEEDVMLDLIDSDS